MGAIISSRLATLHELQTVYGTQDAYDLLEIIYVDKHNDNVIKQLEAEQHERH